MVRLGPDQYVKWSTTVDAPVTHVMSRAHLLRTLEHEDMLPSTEANGLLELAAQTGTSDPDESIDVLLAANRAGPSETWLSVVDIIERYRSPD